MSGAAAIRLHGARKVAIIGQGGWPLDEAVDKPAVVDQNVSPATSPMTEKMIPLFNALRGRRLGA